MRIGLDELDSGLSIVNASIGQLLRHDGAVFVDAKMEVLPASRASKTMFGGGPLALVEDTEAGAIDDQVDGTADLRGAGFDVQAAASSGERRLVGSVKRNAHQAEDRAHEALGLAEREMEHESQCERRFDCDAGVLPLAAASTDRLGLPGCDGVRREPDSQIAALNESAVVPGPVGNSVFRFIGRVYTGSLARLGSAPSGDDGGIDRVGELDVGITHQRPWGLVPSKCAPTMTPCAKIAIVMPYFSIPVSSSSAN